MHECCSIIPYRDMYGHIFRMGLISDRRKAYPQALAYYEQSLAMKASCLPGPTENPLTAALMADTVVNIANVHRQQKEYLKSIAQYEKALNLYKTAFLTITDTRFSLANTYLGLACTYAGLSSQDDVRRERALNYAMQFLAHAHKHGLCNIPQVSTFLKTEPTLEVLREHRDHGGTLQQLIKESCRDGQ